MAVIRLIVSVFGIWLCSLPSVQARTLHVSATDGDNAHDGRSATSAFQTIQRAADLVEPGDEVVIYAGEYFERIELRRFGTSTKPIIFRADAVEKNRVILTSADRELRSRQRPWTLEDSKLGMYSTAFRGEIPARVLYSGADLYPFASLEHLRTFTTNSGPAPRHGYFLDRAEEKLYVRLHASGRYGSTDPGKHFMAVSPRGGYGFGLFGKTPAHVVIEGITFETSANAAVFTEASFVEVRRCWFVGCPYGVRGTRQQLAPEEGRDDSASDVTIAYCDFTEYAAFDDAEELLREAGVSEQHRGDWQLIWHRKTSGRLGYPADRKNYENGIAALIGHNWRIHHNYIHDGFEGLANDGVSYSTGLHVHDNIFARLCDNGVEVENHGRDVRIYRNLFLDVFEPFSFQPLVGPPWPGPIYYYQNIIANSAEHAELWRYALPNSSRGAFKIGISLENWQGGSNADVSKSRLAATAPGLLLFNNTVYFPGGRLLSLLGDKDVPIENVLFANNVLVTDEPIARGPNSALKPGHFQFRNNVVVTFDDHHAADECRLIAGENGVVLDRIGDIGWPNSSARDFTIRSGGRGDRASARIAATSIAFPASAHSK